MIMTWMLYGLVVAALVAVGACAAEALGNAAGYPVRWVWAAAIVLTLALIVAAPVRRATVVPQQSVNMVATSTMTSDAEPTWRVRISAEIEMLRQTLGVPLRAAAVALRRGSTPAVDRYTVGIWTVVSTLLIVSIVGGQARVRRARRRWPITDMQGARVRLAPSTGPIVIGLTRPEIVVPRWLLARSPLEQRLVIAHEAEHVRALDTLLLAGGCLAIALMPWCAALWYMFSRLRLAVELDCDARVLRAGAAPRSYGSLLIDVAEQASDFRFGAIALVAGPSHLQRRLMAMKPTSPRFARTRASAALALASLALITACEAKMPTAADVDALDARSAEVQAKQIAFVSKPDTDSNTVFVVDGSVVSRERAMSLKPAEIATVNVRKSSPSGRIEIDITSATAATAAGTVRTDSASHQVRISQARTVSDSSLTVSGLTARASAATGNAEPLMFIDGVRATAEQFKALDRNAIASVEIVKGRRAAEMYSDPQAAHGVITVTTKKPETR